MPSWGDLAGVASPEDADIGYVKEIGEEIGALRAEIETLKARLLHIDRVAEVQQLELRFHALDASLSTAYAEIETLKARVQQLEEKQ